MPQPQHAHEGRMAGSRHELPTHLHVEDRLIAGLTVRQTLLLSAGVSVSYSLWLHLAGLQSGIQAALAPAHAAGLAALLALIVRLAIAALPAGAFALVALARPADRPLEEWLVIALRYVTLPKTLVWRSASADGMEWRLFSANGARTTQQPRLLLAEDEGDPDEDAEDAYADLDMERNGLIRSRPGKGGPRA